MKNLCDLLGKLITTMEINSRCYRRNSEENLKVGNRNLSFLFAGKSAAIDETLDTNLINEIKKILKEHEPEENK
jgi:hypothetical protein